MNEPLDTESAEILAPLELEAEETCHVSREEKELVF